jgi:hypothetical protein
MSLKVINYSEKQKDFMTYHKTGGAGINYVGFECIDKVWKFANDGVTDITGFPASGKTEFAFELLFYQCEAHGKRFMLYVPDVGGYNEIRRKLIVKYYKRSFRGYDDSVKDHELELAATWIDFHFLIVTKADYKSTITPQALWEFMAEYTDNNGGVSGLLVDSWKNLYHDYKGREDLYLDYVLSYRNEIAEQSKKHIMTIAHPTKTEIEGNANGKRRIPSAYDIKGGGSWFANGKTIITVDKPYDDRPVTDLYFSKVKPDTLGRSANIIHELEFWWKKSRYVEVYDGQSLWAGEAVKQKNNNIVRDITPF